MCLSQMLQLGQDVLLLCAFPFGLSVHMESYPPWCFHVAILSGRLVWAASMVAHGFKREEAEDRAQKSQNITCSILYWLN